MLTSSLAVLLGVALLAPAEDSTTRRESGQGYTITYEPEDYPKLRLGTTGAEEKPSTIIFVVPAALDTATARVDGVSGKAGGFYRSQKFFVDVANDIDVPVSLEMHKARWQRTIHVGNREKVTLTFTEEVLGDAGRIASAKYARKTAKDALCKAPAALLLPDADERMRICYSNAQCRVPRAGPDRGTAACDMFVRAPEPIEVRLFVSMVSERGTVLCQTSKKVLVEAPWREPRTDGNLGGVHLQRVEMTCDARSSTGGRVHKGRAHKWDNPLEQPFEILLDAVTPGETAPATVGQHRELLPR